MVTQVPTIWAIVLVGLAGVALPTDAHDLSVCQSTCSAVPQDLWPYCCETHHTCCEQFADSCINDCLPRVSTGDISAVEERPGLCCALYNLCCFRETLRISSIRNNQEVIEPKILPMTHRFSTLPGGPMKIRQSPVVVPQEEQGNTVSNPTFQNSRTNDDTRRAALVNRPKPTRKSSNSFRDSIRPSIQDEPQIEATNSRNVKNDRSSHRFDVRAPTPTRPSLSQDSKPLITKEDENTEISRAQNSQRSSKLLKLNIPGSSSNPLEAKKTDAPELEEPVQRRKTGNTAKVLERPGPRPLVRTGSFTRPTNTRQVENQEPEARGDEQLTDLEQKRPVKPTLLNRPSQLRPLPQRNREDQTTAESFSQTRSSQNEQGGEFPRPGPLVRLGKVSETTEPVVEVTDKPEQEIVEDSGSRRQGLKSIRPNIKPLRLGNVGAGASDVTLQSEKVSDIPDKPLKEERKDSSSDNKSNQRGLLKKPSAVLQERTQKVATVEEVTLVSKTDSVTEESVRRTTPIRKIKRIRTRGPSRAQSQRKGKPSLDSEVSESQKVSVDAITVTPPTTQSQVSTGVVKNQQVTRRPSTAPQSQNRRKPLDSEASESQKVNLDVATVAGPRIRPLVSRRRVNSQQTTTRGPSITSQPQNKRKPSVDSETPEAQNVKTNTATVTAPARSQVSRLRENSRQAITTFRPPVTEGRSRGRTQESQVRSRSNNQPTQENTRSRSHPQNTQNQSTRTQTTRSRSRSRSRSRTQITTTNRPTEIVKIVQQDTSKNSYLPEPVTEEMIKDIPEATTETAEIKEEKIPAVANNMKEKESKVSSSADDSNKEKTVPGAETKLQPKEQPVNQPRIKKITLLKPRPQSQTPSTEQDQDMEDKEVELKEIQEKEKHLQDKQASERLSLLRPNIKSQGSQQSTSEPETPKKPELQTSLGHSKPLLARQNSNSQPEARQSPEPQTPRQRSEPNLTSARRSSTPTTTRGSGQTPRQSTTRSRGRLTARQQLAQTNQ